jgi:regulator of sigma E protease
LDLISILPAFGGLSFTLLAFVVSLSVIVFVHEFGHYIIGRWSGIKAEVFSLGFGPVLISRVDRRGTQWQFALVPFGGYVKFLGDKDAASAGDYQQIGVLSTEERRQTMHGAPLWARTATVAAGPLFNFILSILIFSSIAFWQGQARDPLTVGAIYPVPYEHGLKTDDVLLEINGKDVPSLLDSDALSDFWQSMSNENYYDYKVLRNERVVSVEGPNLSLARVEQVVPRSAASDARILPGDVIFKVNNIKILRFDELKAHVERSNGALLDLSIWRDGEVVSLQLVPKRVDEPLEQGGFQTVWRIGIVGGQFFFAPKVTTLEAKYALMLGVQNTWRIITGSIDGLYHVVTGAISSCNLSGVIGIAETSGQMARQGGESYIWFIALLSAAVGIVNLFPIPVLDGGHLVFFAYEGLVGRPPATQFLNVLMMAGLTLVIIFMLFAIANDILC